MVTALMDRPKARGTRLQSRMEKRNAAGAGTPQDLAALANIVSELFPSQ